MFTIILFISAVPWPVKAELATRNQVTNRFLRPTPQIHRQKNEERVCFFHYSVLTGKSWLTSFTSLARRQSYFSLRFYGPSGLPISPDLLCWWGFEVPKYVGTPTAWHLRQTWQPVELGFPFGLTT
jgi:hypothetical protein